MIEYCKIIKDLWFQVKNIKFISTTLKIKKTINRSIIKLREICAKKSLCWVF